MLSIIKILLFVIFIAAFGTLYDGSSLPFLGEGWVLAFWGIVAGGLNIGISIYQARKNQEDLGAVGIQVTDEGAIEPSNTGIETQDESMHASSNSEIRDDECLLLGDIDEVLAISKNRPVLLITAKAERGGGEESAISFFMKDEFPLLIENTRKQNCVIVWLNVGFSSRRTTLKQFLSDHDMKYKGAFLFKNGAYVSNVKYKFLEPFMERAKRSAALLEAT